MQPEKPVQQFQEIPGIPISPGAELFTLDLSNLGGRKARRGYESQDLWIAYVLSGFAAGSEDFVCARIEAVEDLDVLLRRHDRWVEQYHQVKSKKEGARKWTLQSLQKDGVLSRFWHLYLTFRAANQPINKSIEFVLVVEGDIDNELASLRSGEGDCSSAQAHLFSLICLDSLQQRDSRYSSEQVEIDRFLRANARSFLDSGTTKNTFARLSRTISERISIPAQAIATDLDNMTSRVVEAFDGFLASFRCESRICFSQRRIIEEATVARLVESGDISPQEARAALSRLLDEIRKESSRPQPTVIDRVMLSNWLGIPRRIILQPKPPLVPDLVFRQDLTEELAKHLKKHSVLSLYGLPKIGKSQLVSGMIDFLEKADDYFWFTFSGDSSDLQRLILDLSSWIGERTSIWQIKDDLQSGRISPLHAFERFRNTPIRGAILVLDDFHKVSDAALTEKLANLVTQSWSESQLVFVGEQKLLDTSLLDVKEMAIHGFEPKEAILFLATLGIDLSESLVQFALLALQVDGHPVMLRAIAANLPKKPSTQQVEHLMQSLPSVDKVSDFLTRLSNSIFFELLQTNEQRAWVRRLAQVPFSITRELAFELASIAPRLEVAQPDWLLLSSSILDRTGVDRYLLPQLVRKVAESDTTPAERKALLVTYARRIFRTAIATRKFDIWDFHNAIFCLLIAEEYEEAAFRFTSVIPSFISLEVYEPFSVLFAALNSEKVHSQIHAPQIRWQLLLAEALLRTRDAKAVEAAFGLVFKRLHRLNKDHPTIKARALGKVSILSLIGMVRFWRIHKRINAGEQVSTRNLSRVCSPVQLGLKVACTSNEPDLISFALSSFNAACRLAQRPNITQIRDALIAIAPVQPLPLLPLTIDYLYGRYAMRSTNPTTDLSLLLRHSKEYLEKRLGDPYLCSEHAAGEILHQHFGNYQEARNRVEKALQKARQLACSGALIKRVELFVADTYWAEGNYEKSAEAYQKLIDAQVDDELLRQFVRERLLDSMIEVGRLPEAAAWTLRFLRTLRRELSDIFKARLYARMAFAHAESGQIVKAGIACWRICRIAQESDSEEIHCLAMYLSAWVLQHLEFSDPAIPHPKVPLQHSNNLSTLGTPDDLDVWRKDDPFRTKGTIFVATIFELTGRHGRSLRLFLRVLKVIQAAEESDVKYAGMSTAILARITRVHLMRNEVIQASQTFKAAIEKKLDSFPITVGQAVYGQWHWVGPVTGQLSDETVSQFFDAAFSSFSPAQSFQAWTRYIESTFLFDRMAVQKGKRCLQEACDLAENSREYSLLATIFQEKLFVRTQQYYGEQVSWIQDALEAFSKLMDEGFARDTQHAFGERLKQFVGEQHVPMLQRVSRLMDRYAGQCSTQLFEVAGFGLYKTAMQFRVISGCLLRIEAYLKGHAQFLSSSDF